MFAPLCCLLVLLLLQPHQGGAVDNITATTPLLTNQTLLSPGQVFELGFFRPNESENSYIGIWYKKLAPSKIVWVANREKPLSSSDTSASLGIGSDGNLKLVDGRGNTVWSTNVSARNYSVASLSDAGNFILEDGSSNELWGSFSNPTDTLLPGMTIAMSTRTGLKQYLISWKSDNDPSPGMFATGLTTETPTQAYTWNSGKPYWRSGPWDKSSFIGIPGMNQNYLSGFNLQQDINQGEAYFSVQTYNDSSYVYIYVSAMGLLIQMNWDDSAMRWTVNWDAPSDKCEMYGTCGSFGVCNVTKSPICSCLEGFIPSSATEWNSGNWTRGCIRQTELNCQNSTNTSATGHAKTDVFLHLSNMKVPDSADLRSEIEDAGDCENWCLSDCSCLAYSYVASIGCMVWRGELTDVQEFGSPYGEDLYIRVTTIGGSSRSKKLTISLTSIFGLIFTGVVMLALWNRTSEKRGRPKKNIALLESTGRSDRPGDFRPEEAWKEQLKRDDATELPFFSFNSIVVATSNFDITNKLGQGGFGSVYKGKLNDGKEVAVKRLSSSSSQGIEEFKNEVVLISKLQHRNLVKLIGCCLEREEQILVYEYLPNKSLDTFLFDSKRKAELGWSKRFRIIQGIARGLLYLHKDSTLRVIHRDLKVSNILLDNKMNPKISDFGLARIFEGTQDLINTCRVVGTLGYLSPEYAMGGVFSEKSDVYSFGVLLLEIVSGKKNTSTYFQGNGLNLLSYAWQLWIEGRGIDILDEELHEYSAVEVMRCFQVGLLCVQDQATDRPDMASVVLMLSGESDLPQPKQPAFTFQRNPKVEIQLEKNSTISSSTLTSTLVVGR